MNAKNIISAFNNEVKSFNTAIRFVFDTAKEASEKIPAAPAKDDQTEEAKKLRKDIKAAEKKNAIIADCTSIVDTFSITANDIKGKAIKALRDKIMERVPMTDVNGYAVKMVKLPSYLKSEIADYANVFAVTPASWIETIITAAENAEGVKLTGYNVTLAPVVSEGDVTESASGDIVNAKGELVESGKIFDTWNKIARCKNIANAAGRVATNATFAEEMKK